MAGLTIRPFHYSGDYMALQTIQSDELGDALRWFMYQPISTAHAIRKAMRSVEIFGIDGTHVLIAAYRMHNRVMANTVPDTTKDGR
jgi:hypothetical protein